jgi:hypothetical protein
MLDQQERDRPGVLRPADDELVGFDRDGKPGTTGTAQQHQPINTASKCRLLMDRLARSTFDLFAIVKRIVDAKAQFRSLAEPWADTGTSTGRLMIAVLGGLADVERDLIRTRTAEGRSRAKAQGKAMGGPLP